jgi:hypothetical protein
LKDPEYRGKSTNRKELFASLERVGGSADEDDDGEIKSDVDEPLSESEEETNLDSSSEEEEEEEEAEEDEDEISAASQSDDDLESEEIDDDESGDEQEDRRDKVRQLLAQETKYESTCAITNSQDGD